MSLFKKEKISLLLYGGSTSNVMYEHCFAQLSQETQQRLLPTQASLIGFSGEMLLPIGVISIMQYNNVRIRNNQVIIKIQRSTQQTDNANIRGDSIHYPWCGKIPDSQGNCYNHRKYKVDG